MALSLKIEVFKYDDFKWYFAIYDLFAEGYIYKSTQDTRLFRSKRRALNGACYYLTNEFYLDN